MKLKDGILTHEVDGKQILVGSGKAAFPGLVRSNETAAYIVDLLKKETTREQVIADMLARYEAPREVIEPDVDKVLDTLRSIGALDE